MLQGIVLGFTVNVLFLALASGEENPTPRNSIAIIPAITSHLFFIIKTLSVCTFKYPVKTNGTARGRSESATGNPLHEPTCFSILTRSKYNGKMCHFLIRFLGSVPMLFSASGTVLPTPFHAGQKVSLPAPDCSGTDGYNGPRS